MAKLDIKTGEWKAEGEGWLAARVNVLGTKAWAFALRVREDENENQRAFDDENDWMHEKLVELACTGKFDTVKIPDWPGDWVIWVEPAS